MNQLEAFIQLLVSVATLLTLAWGLLKMFQTAHEARIARTEAKLAAARAEEAARHAAVKATEAVTVARDVASGVKNIEQATNGMREALVAATAQASFAAGVQAERDNPSGER